MQDIISYIPNSISGMYGTLYNRFIIIRCIHEAIHDTFTCMHTYIDIMINLYFIHAYTYTYMHTHTSLTPFLPHMQVHIQRFIHIHMHKRIHTYTSLAPFLTHMHVHIQRFIYNGYTHTYIMHI